MCVLFVRTGLPAGRAAQPVHAAATAYYDVEAWPKPFATPGYVRGSNSGIFVESPDRIYLLTRGEIKLPDGSGGAAALSEQGRAQKAELRDCIVVANAKGDILERWSQHDHLFAVGGRGPHRIKISPYDPERHVWVIDDSGHQVFKFTHDGKSLVMRLGEPGVRAADEKHLGGPTDIAWLPDGTFFVSDGYRNSRVVKFDKDGRYLSAWGTKGTEPGQFDLPHAVAIDRQSARLRRRRAQRPHPGVRRERQAAGCVAEHMAPRRADGFAPTRICGSRPAPPT
jgi:hypothetical protein